MEAKHKRGELSGCVGAGSRLVRSAWSWVAKSAPDGEVVVVVRASSMTLHDRERIRRMPALCLSTEATLLTCFLKLLP